MAIANTSWFSLQSSNHISFLTFIILLPFFNLQEYNELDLTAGTVNEV